MKTFIAATFLLCCSAFATETVIACRDLAQINDMLADGWTVKHQAVSSAYNSGYQKQVETIFLFTLVAPPPEQLAKAEAERAAKKRAELEQRRAEWLKTHRPEKE